MRRRRGSGRKRAARDDCDADAGPDEPSRGGTLFRFGCVEDDEKDREHAEARASPATKRLAAIVVMSAVSPQISIAQAKTKWLARQSASAPTFASSEGEANVPSR